MTTWQIITLAISCVTAATGLTALVSFFAARKQKEREEGAEEALIHARLDVIKMQNENLIQESHIISEKLDGQNVRLSKLEQTVKDSQLSELPKQIASIEASVKSAHHRIDALENNHNKGE